jgi:bacterioferritin-associated ferredoxin
VQIRFGDSRVYVCVCNAIRERELRDAARRYAGDAETVYGKLGCSPQCCQCLDEAAEILVEERRALMRGTLEAA